MTSETNHDAALLGRIAQLIIYCETLSELVDSPFSLVPRLTWDEVMQTDLLKGNLLHRATESVLIEWNWRMWRLLHKQPTNDVKFDVNDPGTDLDRAKDFAQGYLDLVLREHPEVHSFNPRPTPLAAALLPMLKRVHRHMSAALQAVEQQKAINWV